MANKRKKKPSTGRWRCKNEEECDFEGPKSMFDFGQFGGMPGLGGCTKCGSNEIEKVPPGEENYDNYDKRGIEK